MNGNVKEEVVNGKIADDTKVQISNKDVEESKTQDPSELNWEAGSAEMVRLAWSIKQAV